MREVATWGERAIPSEDWVWSRESDEFDLVAAGRETKINHTPDLRDTEKYRSFNPMTLSAVDIEGMRTLLVAPLILNGNGIGFIVLFRQEVKPFTDEEVTLVQVFAAQAVIAMENVRQFREVQQLLDRERASREVLGLISQNRQDERPVFDTILESASRLFHAPLAFVGTINETKTELNIVAHRGARAELQRTFDELTHDLATSEIVSAYATREKRTIRIDDISQDMEFNLSDPRRA